VKAEIVELTDAEGAFFDPRAVAFPAATAGHWALADSFDPQAVTQDGRWWLRFRAFAVRLDDGRVIIVDAGIGPAHAPSASWAPVPGRLPDSLHAAGIDPAEIGQVVLTHLHTDHIGWAYTGLFPNAAILVQRAEFGWSSLRFPEDRLVLLDGDTKLADGVDVIATPGHTPGHQSVIVEDQVAITGDVLVHAIQLVAPEIGYSQEMDPDLARETRIALLSKGLRLATPHLTEPFITTDRLTMEQRFRR